MLTNTSCPLPLQIRQQAQDPKDQKPKSHSYGRVNSWSQSTHSLSFNSISATKVQCCRSTDTKPCQRSITHYWHFTWESHNRCESLVLLLPYPFKYPDFSQNNRALFPLGLSLAAFMIVDYTAVGFVYSTNIYWAPILCAGNQAIWAWSSLSKVWTQVRPYSWIALQSQTPPRVSSSLPELAQI